MDSYPTAMTEGAYFAVVDRQTGDVIGRFVMPESAQAVADVGNRFQPDRYRVENTRPVHLRAAS